MIKKKNYKQQDHYTQFYNFSIPLPSGQKVIVYYKRYRPKLASTNKVVEIYDLINQSKSQNQEIKNIQSPYPIDRTLQLMTFDQDLKGKIQPILKKIGKIRKFQYGTSEFKNKEIFFCLAIFKYEFDLVKCFRDQFIQALISQQFKFHQKQSDKDDFRSQLIQKYLSKQLEQKNYKIKQLHDQGYNLITNKMDQFKVDRQNNQKWVADLPQVKRQQKSEVKQKDQRKTKAQE